jgi:hypothetical protein
MSSELDELGKAGAFLAFACLAAFPRGALDEEAPFFFFAGRVLGLPATHCLLSLLPIVKNQRKESKTKEGIKLEKSDEEKGRKDLLFISGRIIKT